MDLHQKLTAITIVGLIISGIAGVTSQLWKSSVEIQGQTRKQLTPAGWLSLVIALVGLLASVGSVLIGVSLKNNEALQAKTEAAQKQALQAQEERWRNDTSSMLKEAKGGIEKNLEDTIKGFQDSQNRFNLTQAEIVSSKQSVLESNLHHTNEIIVAGQPLTSLAFSWQLTSASPALWKSMTAGQEEIQENNESVQGSIPRVPYEAMEYESALLPLLSHIARLGDKKPADTADDSRSTNNVLVLIPLDESQNAILSFGQIAPDVSWSNETAGDKALSSGFLGSRGFQVGNSTPSVTPNLAKRANGVSNYLISWDLDSATLKTAIDRKNSDIQPTAKLPAVLKVVIFYDVTMLPFQKNNFSVPYAINLWKGNESFRQYVPMGAELKDAKFALEVNGVRQNNNGYVLKRIYKVNLLDEFDDDIETGCTILEFEAS